MEALLTACRDRLREGLGLREPECDVEMDGRPPPIAGQVYRAVHSAGYTNTDDNPLSLDELYDVSVTISFRAGWLPADRAGREMVRAIAGMYAEAARVRALLHCDYTTLSLANTQIERDSGPRNDFVEPLKFSGCSAPQEKGPEWFRADDRSDEELTAGDTASGWALELSFRGCRRVQTIESQG